MFSETFLARTSHKKCRTSRGRCRTSRGRLWIAFRPIHVTEWTAGAEVEIHWGVLANHGGGYSFRTRISYACSRIPSACTRIPYACTRIPSFNLIDMVTVTVIAIDAVMLLLVAKITMLVSVSQSLRVSPSEGSGRVATKASQSRETGLDGIGADFFGIHGIGAALALTVASPRVREDPLGTPPLSLCQGSPPRTSRRSRESGKEKGTGGPRY